MVPCAVARPRPETPVLQRRYNNAKRLNSGSTIECLRQTGLDWLPGGQRDLLGEFREFFGLRGHRLKLMLGMFG